MVLIALVTGVYKPTNITGEAPPFHTFLPPRCRGALEVAGAVLDEE